MLGGNGRCIITSTAVIRDGSVVVVAVVGAPPVALPATALGDVVVLPPVAFAVDDATDVVPPSGAAPPVAPELEGAPPELGCVSLEPPTPATASVVVPNPSAPPLASTTGSLVVSGAAKVCTSAVQPKANIATTSARFFMSSILNPHHPGSLDHVTGLACLCGQPSHLARDTSPLPRPLVLRLWDLISES